MRRDGPGISGLPHNTPGINLLKEKINAKFEPVSKKVFEPESDNTANQDKVEKNSEGSSQNLIMTPLYKKEQNRIQKEIKRLDDQIKYAKTNGDDIEATRLETQKELYQSRFEELGAKIAENEAKLMDPKKGLSGSEESKDVETMIKEDEAAELEKTRQQTLKELENAETQNKEKNVQPDFGLS